MWDRGKKREATKYLRGTVSSQNNIKLTRTLRSSRKVKRVNKFRKKKKLVDTYEYSVRRTV